MDGQQYFVSGSQPSPSVQPSRRWLSAFPSGHCCAIEALPRESSGRDVIWLSTSVRGWHALLVELLKTEPARRIVVLSGAPQPQEGLQAINVGARGYSHLHAVPELFHEIARVVRHGGLWVGPELVDRVVAATRKLIDAGGDVAAGTSVAMPPNLSVREAEVARAVASGLSNKEVADQLHISERTVKAHLGAIFEKLGVRDRLQLVLRLSRGSKSSP
ncbi:MAG: response regulator transcription factor [Rhodocyclales bacterium]|nr:response regulator transcription factor [Rhodocyclales bacterium]